MFSPYNFSAVASSRYEFVTDNNIAYTAYFSDVTETFHTPVRVLSFGFEPINHNYDRELPRDARIGDTIVTILYNFFSVNEDIILYIPQEVDGRGKERLRLFDIWWASCMDVLACDDLEKDRIVFRYETTKEFIVTVIFKTPQRVIARNVLQGTITELWDISSKSK